MPNKSLLYYANALTPALSRRARESFIEVGNVYWYAF
jgi:hypothetical protein